VTIMHSFEAIEASILLGIILITIKVRNRVRFKRRRNHSRGMLVTALFSSMLLVGMFFAGVQSVNGAIPTYANNGGASFNATEYVTGTNTTTETYTTQNSFSNTDRKTNFTVTPPQDFNLQGNITIFVRNMNATEDWKSIEEDEADHLEAGYFGGQCNAEIACNFSVPNYANLTAFSVHFLGLSSSSVANAYFRIKNQLTDPDSSALWSSGSLNSGYESDKWHTFPVTGVNLTPNQYYYLILDCDEFTSDETGLFAWHYSQESTDGTDDNQLCLKLSPGGNFIDEITSGFQYDLTLLLRVLKTSSDWAQNATYSSADQVDMRVNGEVVGENNSVSFYSSPSVFVFTTNTSVVFQKNWTALFMRNFSVSSSPHKVVNSSVVWNLNYSLGPVSNRSDTVYLDRGVNITSIPSNWSVDSANPGNAVKYGNTIIVTLIDNDAHPNAFVICNSPRAIIDFDLEEYNTTYGDKVSILFRFYYGEKNLSANNVMINGTVNGTFFECHYVENGWHNITYYTASLDAGDFVLVIQVYNSEYGALGQEEVVLHIKNQVISQEGFVDQLRDYLLYIVLLILGAFGSIAVARNYYARSQEWLDRQKIHRIMVVWEVFALYDQTPSEVITEGSLADKDLVSGLFTAIKDIAKDVSGATLETMKVYPNHPHYFVYTGEFYCVLILTDRPSPRLEEKLILFARVVEEKYRGVVEEKYGKSFFSGCGIPETRLDLDGEVMRIFGLIPITSLQDIVAVSLSYGEIDKLKVRDDVKKVLMTGRALTDKLGKFPLEKLIQVATNSLGDIMRAHSAVLKVLKLGLITVVGKPTIPKEKPILLEIKPEPESVKKVEEEKKEEKKRKEKRRKEEEFYEKYYESTLSLEEIDLKKDIRKDEKIALKYVRAYNDQVGLGIKGDTMIEGLKKEFENKEKKAIKVLKKTLKTGYLQESSG